MKCVRQQPFMELGMCWFEESLFDGQVRILIIGKNEEEKNKKFYNMLEKTIMREIKTLSSIMKHFFCKNNMICKNF